MSTEDQRQIQAHDIRRGTAEYDEILNWRYSDDEAFVSRLLKNDIPQRIQYKNGSLWVYRDRNNVLVGFGSLDFCDEYAQFANDGPHPYIPLLAVNPSMRGHGYGKQILNHLIDQAALVWAYNPQSCDRLFLDVYTTNKTAIGLYQRFGFIEINGEPIPDPDQGGETYIIMARRISIAQR